MKDVVFGMDATIVIPLSGAADTEGTPVVVPGRAFSFDNEVDTETFDADNQRIATRNYNKRISGSLEAATHTPVLLGALGNGEITTTGTDPNQGITYAESGLTVDKYVRIKMRSYSGDGAVTEAVALKVQPSGASFDFGTGAFAPITADFEGIADAVDGNLWTVSQLNGTLAVLTFA